MATTKVLLLIASGTFTVPAETIRFDVARSNARDASVAAGRVYYGTTAPNPPPATLRPFDRTDFSLDVDANNATDGGIRGDFGSPNPRGSGVSGNYIHIRVEVAGTKSAAFLNPAAIPATTWIDAMSSHRFPGAYDNRPDGYNRHPGESQALKNARFSTLVQERSPWVLFCGGIVLLAVGRLCLPARTHYLLVGGPDPRRNAYICKDDMLMCMRTTLNLEDHLMRRVKQRAAETGRTLTEILDLALRELLERESRPVTSYRLRWVAVRGAAQPPVDITDRDALLTHMERSDRG